MSRTTSYLLRPLASVMLAAVAAVALAAVALVAASPAARAEDGNCQPSGNEVVCTFDTPGTSTWTVPNGVTRATFDVFGAQGGKGGFDSSLTSGYGGQGGLGGEAKATFSNLQPASQLQVNVGGAGQAGGYEFGEGGQGGLNGGADSGFGYSSSGGGGGGASDVRSDTDGSGDFALDERLIVAGGGGGGGGGLYCYVEEPVHSSYILLYAPGYPGGSGGGTTGKPGEGGYLGRPEGGGGGTVSAGGARGSYWGISYDGDFGIGGTGGTNGDGCPWGGGAAGGGGGGGGYYGGGGGGSSYAYEIIETSYGGAGGGGGSGFVSSEGANALLQPEVNSGAGKVTITYTPDTTSPTVKEDAKSPTPQDGATGVSRTTTVSASFSEEVQEATLTSNVQLFSGKSTRPIKATLSWDPSTNPTSVTLTPSSKLDAKTRYTAKIKGGSTGVKDLAGNPVDSDFSWTFTTGSM